MTMANGLRTRRHGDAREVTLSPYAGEPEPTEPASSGEWAAPLAALAGTPQAPPWCWYMARRDGTPVGMGAFKGPPDANGAVEIAYLTFIPARGQNVASAVAAALIDIARTQGAATVRAHTLPETSASTAVLVANGFDRVGAVEDPEDGTVWRWEREV